MIPRRYQLRALCGFYRKMTALPCKHNKGSINLLAHIIAQQAQTSFNDTFEYLLDNPDHVSTFESDMLANGIDIVHADADVSVFNITSSQNRDLRIRTLHFNTELDLVQSAVALNTETADIDFDLPLPFDFSNYIIGMSFSFLFHFLNGLESNSMHGSSHRHLIQRCAVLGAGGCILPVLISRLFPTATVDAVEISHPVVAVARTYFGVDPYISDGKVILHETCALQWLRSLTINSIQKCGNKNEGSFDMIFVDICEMQRLEPVVESHEKESSVEDIREKIHRVTLQDVLEENGEVPCMDDMDLVAPSQEVLREDTCRLLVSSLNNQGILAINVLADERGLDYATSCIAAALKGHSDVHIGVMRLPVSSATSNALFGEVIPGFNTEEDGKDEEMANTLTRFNSVVFVTKNPSQLLLGVVSGKNDSQSCGETLETAALEYIQSHKDANNTSKTPLPFDRTGIVQDDLRKWIYSYKGTRL